MLLSVAAGYAIAHFRLEKELIAVLADLPSTQHKVGGGNWRELLICVEVTEEWGFTCFLGIRRTCIIEGMNDLEAINYFDFNLLLFIANLI